MHFHANFEQPTLQSVKEKYGLSRFHVSADDLDDAGITARLADARIALCWYHPYDENTSLTAFSSEKLARYTSLGLPVIVNADSNFDKLFSRFRCGEALRDMTELPHAIARIEADYDSYRLAAFAAYDAYYNHDINFEKFYTDLMASGILKNSPALPKGDTPCPSPF